MTDAIVSIGTPPKLSDGLQAAPKLNVLGYTRISDFLFQSVLEGRGFHAAHGSESTPITLSTTYDEDQPELVVRVPDGTTIIPVYMATNLETAAGTVTSIIYGLAENDIGNATSSAATLGPDNMLVSTNARASACVVRGDYSANSTALTNKREFFRRSFPFVDAAATVDRNVYWSIKTQGVPFVLKGPASLIVWSEATTTAASGYHHVAWVEYLTSELV